MGQWWSSPKKKLTVDKYLFAFFLSCPDKTKLARQIQREYDSLEINEAFFCKIRELEFDEMIRYPFLIDIFLRSHGYLYASLNAEKRPMQYSAVKKPDYSSLPFFLSIGSWIPLQVGSWIPLQVGSWIPVSPHSDLQSNIIRQQWERFSAFLQKYRLTIRIHLEVRLAHVIADIVLNYVLSTNFHDWIVLESVSSLFTKSALFL
jgi:hypothetical protein